VSGNLSYNTGMDWQIFGHDWAVNLLRTHAAGNKLRHAYLFVGPEGIGRRTLALRFAQALNCRQAPEPGAFCGICRDCRQTFSMQYPDLSLVVPEEGHKDIRIDQIRSLQHTLALAPYAASYRVALLPNFQYVTEQAENALLKTLEEPPDRVILLLTALSPEGLLPTISSRCEVIRLRPASISESQVFLQADQGLPNEKADLIAHLSGGRIGAAIRLSQDNAALSRRKTHLLSFLELLSARRYERFMLAETLSKDGSNTRPNVREVLSIWLSYWRDVFVRCSGAEIELVNVDLLPQVDHVAAKMGVNEARKLVLIHEKALQQLDAYANVRLLLETLMLQWPTFTEPMPAV